MPCEQNVPVEMFLSCEVLSEILWPHASVGGSIRKNRVLLSHQQTTLGQMGKYPQDTEKAGVLVVQELEANSDR